MFVIVKVLAAQNLILFHKVIKLGSRNTVLKMFKNNIFQNIDDLVDMNKIFKHSIVYKIPKHNLRND